MRLLIALGGNALRAASSPAPLDPGRVELAAAAVAELAAVHEPVVTHGNGPQVGWLALQSLAAGSRSPDPLDVLDAESEGWIGHVLELALRSRLPGRAIATLLSQVEVDADDPAFARPSKPVGPPLPLPRVAALLSRGQVFEPGPGPRRRLVASPEPRRLLAIDAVEALLRAGVLVICAGGGGIPVVRERDGRLRGVEAVVDKDLTSALVASATGAEALLLLTDVPSVFRDFGTSAAQPIGSTVPGELRRQRFEPGSMAPKVEAAIRFVEAGGRRAAIGRLEDAAALLAGEAGTQVLPG